MTAAPEPAQAAQHRSTAGLVVTSAASRRDVACIAVICAVALGMASVAMRDPLYSDAAGWFVGTVNDITAHHGNPVVQPHNDVGHPPLIPALVALLWEAAPRNRLLVAHALTTLLGLIAPVFLYLAMRRFVTDVASLLCTLGFVSSPLYAGQIGMVYIDLPAASFVTAGLWAAVVGSPWALVAFAIAGSLTKVTAIPPLAACGLYLAWQYWQQGGFRATKRLVVPALCAAVPYAVWLVVHYHYAGYLFVPPSYMSHVGGWCYESPVQALKQWLGIMLVFSVEDFRFVLIIAVIAAGVHGSPGSWRFAARDRGQVLQLLLAVILACSIGIAAGNFQMMRRYWLPALPALYAFAYLAMSATSRRLAVVCFAILTPLQVAMWFCQLMPILPFDVGERCPGQSPVNCRYRDTIRCHQEAADVLRAHWSEAQVLTDGWLTRELSVPQIGYVDVPLTIVRYDPSLALVDQTFDVVCVETRGPYSSPRLAEAANGELLAGRLAVIGRFTKRHCEVLILGRASQTEFSRMRKHPARRRSGREAVPKPAT